MFQIKLTTALTLIGCFIANGQVWGNLYSYSVINKALVTVNPHMKMHTSLMGSMLFGFTLFFTILMAPLMQYITVRRLYVIGIAIYTIGPLISAFISDLHFWYLTYIIPITMGGASTCILSYAIAARCYPDNICASSTFVSVGTSVFAFITPLIWQLVLSNCNNDIQKSLLIIAGYHASFIFFTPCYPDCLISKQLTPSNSTNLSNVPAKHWKSAVSMQMGSMISLQYIDKVDKIDHLSLGSGNLGIRHNSIKSSPSLLADIEVVKEIPPPMRGHPLLLALRKKRFIFWLVVNMIHFSVNGVIYVHLTRYATSLTDSRWASSTWFMLSLAIGGTIGKILCAVLVELHNASVIFCDQISLIMFGVGLCLLGLLNFAENVSLILFGLYVACFIIGLGEGPIWSLAYAATYVTSYPVTDPGVFCLFCCSIAVPYCLGGPIGEAIYKSTQSYQLAFYIAAFGYLLAANVIWFIPPVNETSLDHKENNVVDEIKLTPNLKKRLAVMTNISGSNPESIGFSSVIEEKVEMISSEVT